MFKNYFKIAFRNLWKNKVFSSINIIGLAIGLAASIMIMLFVFYEKSFDNFHTKNIYRLNEVQKFEGMIASQKVALSMFPMGPTLKNEFPEILNFTRVMWRDKYQMTYGEKRVNMPSMYFVDSTFLQMFDFAILKGNRSTALQKPNSVVLTQAAAERLFGKEDPLGKTVYHYASDTLTFVVTGIMKNVPQNSQFQFDGLFSFNTIYKPDWIDRWNGNWLDTYLELAPGTSIASIEKKFPAYLKKYMSRNDNWKRYELFLLALKDVHASAGDIGLDYLNYQKFDKNYTNLFFIIGLVVLLIACINFMNLSTARSAERAREVGVRKSVGALRWQLAAQFLGESVFLCLIALVVAILLVIALLPFVNAISQRDLKLSIFNDGLLFITLISGTVIIGILSGLYPAAYLSSFNPTRVLKGAIQTGKNKGLLRNVLVVGQFTSAIFLMIATVFAVRQLDFMQKRDTGYNRDQVVTIPLNDVTFRKFDVLKQELVGNSLVEGASGAQDELGSHLDQSGIEFKGNGPLRQLSSTRLIVDPDYLRLYKIPLVHGRDFSNEKSARGTEYIINESLARELLKDETNMPMSSLINKHFGFDSAGHIVGIAKDFNFNSLHYKIETMFLFNQEEGGFFKNLSVKINGAKAKEAIAFIQSVWQKNFPENTFEYHFLDDHFAEIYQADEQVSKIVGALAVLAIIISCLGLFGLASYAAEKRIKEVGIRKVLGASVQNIVGMLSRDFLKYVLIAVLIAWPLAWFGVYKWLQDYAYRIPINAWIFLSVGLIAVVISLLTISFQAVRAAVANPVKSLRTE
ncbi:MAG: ABC transporter permease [Ferruginibacter sp.]